MDSKSGTCRMAEETVLKFIECYRKHGCLWNTSCPEYKSKEARAAAYRSISKEMAVSRLGPREVSRKIRSLRSAYNHELRKLEDHRQERAKRKTRGDPGEREEYDSKVIWFHMVDSFLRPAPGTRVEDEAAGSSKEEVKPMEDRSEQTATDRPPHISIFKNAPVEIDEKSISGSQLESSPTSKRKKISFPKVMDKSTLTLTTVDDTIDRGTVDDYEYFGKYIAASLRRMPFEYRISAESEIHDVLIKYKVYAMRKSASQQFRVGKSSTSDDKLYRVLSAQCFPSNQMSKPLSAFVPSSSAGPSRIHVANDSPSSADGTEENASNSSVATSGTSTRE